MMILSLSYLNEKLLGVYWNSSGEFWRFFRCDEIQRFQITMTQKYLNGTECINKGFLKTIQEIF